MGGYRWLKRALERYTIQSDTERYRAIQSDTEHSKALLDIIIHSTLPKLHTNSHCAACLVMSQDRMYCGLSSSLYLVIYCVNINMSES